MPILVRCWLLQSDAPPDEDLDTNEDDDDAAFFCVHADTLSEAAKAIADCWPNSLVEIAKAIGSSQNALQWFFTEKAALPIPQRVALAALLGLEFDEEYSTYEADLPRVLVAFSLRKIIAVYDLIGHGGDVEHSFEAVPERVPADPSWRYLVVASSGGFPSILMFPRGSLAADKLDREHFMNFTGMPPVSDELYRDIVQTCARACTAPSENVDSAMGFWQRREEELAQYERTY